MFSKTLKQKKRARRGRRALLAALLLGLSPGLLFSDQIRTKIHSFSVDGAGATVCADGAVFDGTTTAAGSVGLVMTSEVWDAAGTTLLATGNSHTFSTVPETFPFTVMGAFTVGSTVALVVTNVPGSAAPLLGGTQGDADTATVADCSIMVPTMPAAWLSLLVLLLLGGGAALSARSRRRLPRAAAGAGLGVLLLACLVPEPATASVTYPAFDKVFVPDTIGPGSTSMLVFTIDNTGGSGPVGNLAFTDILPGPVDLAAPAFVSNGCAGTLDLDDDSDIITLSDGMLGVGAKCTIVVNVTSSTPGTHMNLSGDLTFGIEGNAGPASADLTVDTGFPGFTKSFAPNPVEFGDRSRLTFLIDNIANGSNETLLAFSDTLPAGMVIADPANAASDCGSPSLVTPIITADPGTDFISFTVLGGVGAPAVEAGETCTVGVDVVAGEVGELGNVSDDLEVADEDFTGKATAVLEVTGFTTLLQLDKDFTDDPVTPGGTVTLKFTLTNKSRDFPATAISFDDDLTGVLAGLSAVGLPLTEACDPDGPLGPLPGTGTLSGTTMLSFTGGSLPVDDDLTAEEENVCEFAVTLAVPLGAPPGSYGNTTTAVSGTIDGMTETGNIAGDLLFVDDFPVLTKEFTDDPVGAGGSVTLSFTITNTNSSSALTDIAFNDDLNTAIPTNDAGQPGLAANSLVSGGMPDPLVDPCGPGSELTVSSFTFGMFTSVDETMLEFTGGSLAKAGTPGDSCTFEVVLDVREGVPGGVYTNTTGEITGEFDGPESTTGPPASGDLIVVGAPILGKTFTDDPVAPGGSVTLEFSLAHSEAAPAAATGIAFTDNLAALAPPVSGLTATAVGPPAPTVPPTPACDGTVDITTDPTLIDYSGGSLAPDASCGFSVTLSVPGGATPGLKTNKTSDVTATVDGLATVGSAAEDKLLISGFRLRKEFTDDPVIAGDTATLKFTLDNTSGTVDATAISFDDELDEVIDGMTPVAFPPTPCGGTLTVTDGSKLNFDGGSVTAAASCDFDVTVLVPATVDPPGPPPPIPTPDDVYLNSTDAEEATIGATLIVPDRAVDGLEVNSTLLEITKEFTNDPVAPGGMVSLKFTLANLSSTETVTDIAFGDDLGAALAGLTATGAAVNTCSGMAAGFPTTMFSYTGGTLMPGATCTVTVTVSVPAAPLAKSPPFVNTTSGVTGKVGVLDVYGDPGEDELLVQLLKISKEFTDDPGFPGETVTLEFTLTNLGTEAVSGLAFTDDLSAVIAGLEATTLPAAGVCGPGSAMSGTSFLTFTGGSLAGGGFCVIPVTLTLPAAAPDGVFVNRTSRLREQGAPVAPAASALLVVESPPAFAKEFSPDPIGESFTSTLTFTIDNTASAVAASDIDFLDMLPVGLEVAAAPMVTNTCGGSVVAPAGSVSISLSNGMVAAGATCTLSADVTALSEGVFVNETGDLTSTSGNSGSATDTLTVIGCTAADGANLTLTSGVVLGTEMYEVCNTITVPEHFTVLGPSGVLILRAGVAVIVSSGVKFGAGSTVTIEIDPSLIP